MLSRMDRRVTGKVNLALRLFGREAEREGDIQKERESERKRKETPFYVASLRVKTEQIQSRATVKEIQKLNTLMNKLN